MVVASAHLKPSSDSSSDVAGPRVLIYVAYRLASEALDSKLRVGRCVWTVSYGHSTSTSKIENENPSLSVMGPLFQLKLAKLAEALHHTWWCRVS